MSPSLDHSEQLTGVLLPAGRAILAIHRQRIPLQTTGDSSPRLRNSRYSPSHNSPNHWPASARTKALGGINHPKKSIGGKWITLRLKWVLGVHHEGNRCKVEARSICSTCSSDATESNSSWFPQLLGIPEMTGFLSFGDITMKKPTLRSLTIFAALIGAVATASASDFSRVVAMGDSLSDPGNGFVLTGNVAVPPFDPVPRAAYAIGGHHVSNGRTWAEQLAKDLKLLRSAGPALRVPKIFSNYALAGSRARPEGWRPAIDQVNLFLSDFNKQAPSDALYLFAFGGNDVLDALVAYIGTPAIPPNPPAAYAILTEAVDAIADNLVVLCDAGARHIMVGNFPNTGITRAVLSVGDTNGELATGLALAANVGLKDALDKIVVPQCPSTQFLVLDIFSILTDIAENPESYGFVDNSPCLKFEVTANAICANPNRKFFWDALHPTKAGHRFLADAAANLLKER